MTKKNWFYLFLVLLVIDLFLPDPLPVIDELILLVGTIKTASDIF